MRVRQEGCIQYSLLIGDGEGLLWDFLWQVSAQLIPTFWSIKATLPQGLCPVDSIIANDSVITVLADRVVHNAESHANLGQLLLGFALFPRLITISVSQPAE